MTNKCAYRKTINIYSDVPLDFTYVLFLLVSKVGNRRISRNPHGTEPEVLIAVSIASVKFRNLYITYRF